MRRFAGFVVSVMLVFSIFALAACEGKGGGGDPLVGTWAMVDSPTKTVSISKEGDKYFYTGSQGKTEAKKIDANTLSVPMSGIEVTVKFDSASNELIVSFMGEAYKYKKAK